jgi:hypothetical protein
MPPPCMMTPTEKTTASEKDFFPKCLSLPVQSSSVR